MDFKEMQAKTFRPINGRMLIKVDPLDKVSKGGIKLITQQAQPVDRGTIVSISYDGCHPVTNKPIDNSQYNVGDRVVFNYGVKEYIEFADGMHVLLDKTQIYAVLLNEDD